MLREFKKRGELLHEADDATLSTNDLIDVLGISKPTLNRLRQRRTIPFRYISANQVVYPYRDLVREIMMGRITFKGLSKMNALQRLQAFQETIPLHCDTGAANHAARAERQPPRQQATPTASCHPSEVPQSKYQQGKACCPHEEEVWYQPCVRRQGGHTVWLYSCWPQEQDRFQRRCVPQHQGVAAVLRMPPPGLPRLKRPSTNCWPTIRSSPRSTSTASSIGSLALASTRAPCRGVGRPFDYARKLQSNFVRTISSAEAFIRHPTLP